MMGENPVNGNSSFNNNPLAQMGFANDGHRTLYIGNLDPSINETFINTLFSVYGRISGLKMISDNLNDPYCFVEFEESSAANNALTTMNKRIILGREIKVNWATSPTCSGPKQDTSKHFHIFVGDLSTELESAQLRDAFAPFGEISDCRVVRDPHTQKSKGYGFVSFLKKTDAEIAIQHMNGQWLGSRPIRTNWASRKPPGAQVKSEPAQIGPNPTTNNRQLNFEEVYNQSSLSNCTVYCGGITNGLSEEMISKAFNQFGPIQEIRVFKEKGYAFIKFISKEAATNAIVMMHNQEIQGQTIKCSWGKESTEGSVLSSAAQLGQGIAPPLIYPYGQQMSYNPWYGSPPNYSGQPYAVPPTGVQYSYGNQYYGSQQAQSNPGQYSHGLGIPGGSWQNSGGAPPPPPPHLSAAVHHSSAMGPYAPMQGYQ